MLFAVELLNLFLKGTIIVDVLRFIFYFWDFSGFKLVILLRILKFDEVFLADRWVG